MSDNSIFKENLFEGKKVFITGGATGMGLGFAKSFLNHGADVMIASRKKDNLILASNEAGKEAGKELLWKVMDVRDNASVEEVADFIGDEWGKLDILVNNAAGNFISPVSSMSENAWRAVVDIVLDGTFRVSKACYPLLRKSELGSSIVNIIANYAWNAAPFVAHSGAAKAGVLNLTRTLALEWASDNIRVNAFCPGVVLTENVKKNLMLDEETAKMFENYIPLGGITDSDKMAQQVLYLCSPAADVITGDMLIADGGQWLVGNAFYQAGKQFLDE
tara:strand:- start:250 stop:1077 length:828 start_codon:yes stop_codon:yes gene_type:complete